jgi:hypothetical protein
MPDFIDGCRSDFSDVSLSLLPFQFALCLPLTLRLQQRTPSLVESGTVLGPWWFFTYPEPKSLTGKDIHRLHAGESSASSEVFPSAPILLIIDPARVFHIALAWSDLHSLFLPFGALKA